MCEDCGCDELHTPANKNKNHGHEHDHTHEHGHSSHSHTISINKDVLQKNDEYAAENRAFFDSKKIYTVNLISSPGSGKTSLLEALAGEFGEKLAVIEGDIQTRRDAERVIRAGSRAHQIETGGACHLDAHGIAHAADHLDFEGCEFLIIENVGNLVCPATYELGEHMKAAILSIPEGDDKVLKYPAIFSRIGALLINKIDLAPYIEFDTQKAVNECRSLNRKFETFKVSAKTGEGIKAFCDFLVEKRSQLANKH
jgi:hydrogenase nickel incorporation protein HypB